MTLFSNIKSFHLNRFEEAYKEDFEEEEANKGRRRKR